jgi:tetratricopeptide (TPR) repeat protein
LLISIVFLSLSGCVAMQVEREVQSGRTALRLNNPKAAIPHFEVAAGLAPDYLSNFSPLQISIWTYIGRAYYEAGDRTKALESFKRARERYSDDYLARAYLGAIVTETGQRAEGVKEIEIGLSGLKTWLETLPGRSLDGKYWDPGRHMVNAMAETLSLLRAEKADWKQVGENVRWLGRNLDEEIEKARRDRDRDHGAGSEEPRS